MEVVYDSQFNQGPFPKVAGKKLATFSLPRTSKIALKQEKFTYSVFWI